MGIGNRKRDLPAAAEARAEDERETVATENLNSLSSVALSTSTHTTNYSPPVSHTPSFTTPQ